MVDDLEVNNDTNTEARVLLSGQYQTYVNNGEIIEEEKEGFSCCCKCLCCCSCWLSCWDNILSFEFIQQRNVLTFWKDSCRHLWRGLSTNLSLRIASDFEKGLLSEKGVTGKYAQNYLTWRRSCLYTIIIPILVHLIFSVYNVRDIQTVMQQLETQYPILADSFQNSYSLLVAANIFTTVVQSVALILALVAVTKWYKYDLSRRLAVWSWILFFFSPFLVTFVPYRSVIELPPNLDPDTKDNYRSTLGFAFGVYYFLNLAPGTLTLSLALFRSALNLRSLLPQNALMGYFCVLVPIVTTPLIWLAFVPIMQSIGNAVLLFSLIVFSFSPLTFLIFSKYITTPMTITEAHKYATRLRMGYLIVLSVSVLGVLYFITTGRFELMFSEYLTFSTMFEFCFSFLSEYFFGYVFATDLFITIALGTAKRKDESIPENDLEKENIERMNQLFQILDV